MIGTDIPKRETRDLWVAIAIALSLGVYHLLFNIISFLQYISYQYYQLVSNLLFFWILALLWVAYRRWRNAVYRQRKLRNILESIKTEVIMVVDSHRRIQMVNESVNIFGYSPEEVIKKTTDLLYLDRRVDKNHPTEIRDAIDQIGFHIGQATGRKRTGETFPLEIMTVSLKESEGVVVVIRDITERKRMEEALIQSEEKNRTIIENIEDGYVELDLKGNFIFFNDAFSKMHGYSRNELIKMNYRDIMDEENAGKIYAKYNKVFTTGESEKEFEYEIITKSGLRKYLETSITVIKNTDGRIVAFRGIVRDRTEHRQVEKAMRQSEEKYRSILENIREAYFEVDLAGNFTFFNESLCRLTGCSKEELLGANYIKFSHEENTKNIFMTFNKVYETGELVEGSDWPVMRKDGSKGYVEASVLLRKDSAGKPIGFRGVLRDITERKRAEEKLQQTIENLRYAFGTTIQVMVSAVEMRDPYTAGHLIRSADIARAIATEMGLDKNKIDGIRVAGSIHDIGKLTIPAEILSRPTKLTNLEFSLIKEHPKSGYEMLKDVESFWPLAEIVYQHHERMNGTGYPRNLKGDEIILEARILGVADVVEAMASHRPYRASLGIEAALEEIENNKGILYDTAVADACLRLFREKGYQLIHDGGKQSYKKKIINGNPPTMN